MDIHRNARTTPRTVTAPCDTSDPKPGFVGVAGVKPREATAEGGSGLTPDTPTQAKSVIGGDNFCGNSTWSAVTNTGDARPPKPPKPL